MKLLLSYLKHYKGMIVLTLVLAAINTFFSMLDSLIMGILMNDYAAKRDVLASDVFFRGVTLLLGAAVGVAFVSRVAKNFQDYYINVITQRLGARIYSDGICHSLQLPYSV